MGLMERRSIDQIKGKFIDLYKPALVTNWQVWPIAQVRLIITPCTSCLTVPYVARQLPLYALAISGAIPICLRRILDSLSIVIKRDVRQYCH
jgi:hypothetical protein